VSYFAEISDNNDKVQTDKKTIATKPMKSNSQGFVPKGQGSIKKEKD